MDSFSCVKLLFVTIFLLKFCFTKEIGLEARHAEESHSSCKSPKHPGKCKGRFIRYYYNSETNECLRFLYGGCENNGNNFRTKRRCESTCKERFAPALHQAQKDEVFNEKERKPDCSAPKDMGPCRAHFIRYYYDIEADQCTEFIFGGCQGNGNNFVTQRQCETTCKKGSAEEDNVSSAPSSCSAPKEIGPCFMHIKHYHFDKETGRCDSFIYGGCKGNDNNYGTLQDCLKACTNRDSVCMLPSDAGPCRARMLRYYFDNMFGICREFNYGGCSGNGNNFENITECFNYCKQ